MSYSDEDYDEKYEEYCKQYEEEGPYVYGSLLSDENDEFYISSYDEVMRPRSIHDGFSCRGGQNEPFIYLADYWGLSDGLLKHLSFLYYCSLEIENWFKHPYHRQNMKRIAIKLLAEDTLKRQKP